MITLIQSVPSVHMVCTAKEPSCHPYKGQGFGQTPKCIQTPSLWLLYGVIIEMWEASALVILRFRTRRCCNSACITPKTAGVVGMWVCMYACMHVWVCVRACVRVSVDSLSKLKALGNTPMPFLLTSHYHCVPQSVQPIRLVHTLIWVCVSYEYACVHV